MEEQLNELFVQLESLKMQVAAIKTALLNIKGFYIETEDGSQQGLIKYGTPVVQVDPVEVGA